MITPEHLEHVAARLEASTRRELDQLRADVGQDFRGVHARINEVRQTVKEQNGRVGKLELAVSSINGALSALQASSGLSWLKLVGAMIAALAALAGVAEVAEQIGRVILQAVTS